MSTKHIYFCKFVSKHPHPCYCMYDIHACRPPVPLQRGMQLQADLTRMLRGKQQKRSSGNQLCCHSSLTPLRASLFHNLLMSMIVVLVIYWYITNFSVNFYCTLLKSVLLLLLLHTKMNLVKQTKTAILPVFKEEEGVLSNIYSSYVAVMT